MIGLSGLTARAGRSRPVRLYRALRSHSARILDMTLSGRTSVAYIVEDADWSIRKDGEYICEALSARGFNCRVDISPRFLRRTLIHFGSLHAFAVNSRVPLHDSNRLTATLFHGDFGISADMDKNLKLLLDNRDRLEKVVVSASMMERRLISWGLPPEKIVLIPLGVDLRRFRPCDPGEKAALRRELGIPAGAVCVGSFQKDGNGWGEGMEPKRVKAPEAFVAVLKALAKEAPVHCLLTGPSRGFVKRGLEEAGVPYTHRYLESYLDIVRYYQCLDLYLITSREEGGPKAITECFATGIPLVSTRVGMVPDLAEHGRDGFLAEVDDVEAMTAAMRKLISDPALRSAFAERGLEKARGLGWEGVGERYASVFKPILEGL